MPFTSAGPVMRFTLPCRPAKPFSASGNRSASRLTTSTTSGPMALSPTAPLSQSRNFDLSNSSLAMCPQKVGVTTAPSGVFTTKPRSSMWMLQTLAATAA